MIFHLSRPPLSSGSDCLERPVYLLSPTVVDGALNLGVIETLFFEPAIDIDEFDALIFTSKNGVLGLDRLGVNWKKKPSIAIGEATSKAIKSLKGRVSFVGLEAYGDELASEIVNKYRFLKFLYPRAKTIASNLPQILKERGVDIADVPIYETVCAKNSNEAPDENSIIVFSSPSTAKCFFKKYGWRESYGCVAIGKTTAASIDFCSDVRISPKQTLEAAVIFAKNEFLMAPLS